MLSQDKPYGVVSASTDCVSLRVLHDISAQMLCDGLGLSKRIQRRVFAEGMLARAQDGEALVGQSPLHAGEDVALRLQETRASGPLSEEPVELLWHDRFALAANKPVGLLVHGDGTGADTLMARVQAEVARAAVERGWSFVPVVQPLNRLDVDTSGIVLFSQTEEFQPAFDALIASHAPALIRKRYLAVVEGAFPKSIVTMTYPIARDRHDARRMRVGSTGKSATTLARCLERKGNRSLVACELRSGRRHQIRVHLARERYPIVGDVFYGCVAPDGLMLHAYELRFLHPITEELVVVRTPWPERFESFFPPRDVDWPA